MRPDDRDDPFEDFFDQIERMMNEMMGSAGEFRVEHSMGPESGSSASGAVHVDIHETDDELRVVADLPGVPKTAIDLECDGRRLTIDASGDGREYHERVRLPTTVDEHSADATYNNGILEVSFQTAADSTDIGL
jgi:HSP20 family protein